MAVTEDQLNKALKRYLKSIVTEKVKMDETEATENIQIIGEVLNRLVNSMKEVDPLFKQLYQRPVYTGSYYENLRVKSADEFDLNLVIRLPFNSSEVKISVCPYDPAYVTYQLQEKPKQLLLGHQKMRNPFDKILQKDFFDSQGYLQQHNVSRWIQSVISKAKDTGAFQEPPEVKLIRSSRGGPAFTYYITTSSGKRIDVDLVPVIDAAPYYRPEGLNPGIQFDSLPRSCKNDWFLVPKPFKPQNTSFYDDDEDGTLPVRYWRMSFPAAEKKLLQDTGCLTMVIKLFKLLRDCNEYWRVPMASYFIKTFFLLEYEKYDPEDWEEINLGSRYIEMLRKFQAAIEDRRIPYYFNREGNLLSSMSSNTAYNISRRIERILRDTMRNPSSIMTHYGIYPNTTEAANVESSVQIQEQQENGWSWNDVAAGVLLLGLFGLSTFRQQR